MCRRPARRSRAWHGCGCSALHAERCSIIRAGASAMGAGRTAFVLTSRRSFRRPLRTRAQRYAMRSRVSTRTSPNSVRLVHWDGFLPDRRGRTAGGFPASTVRGRYQRAKVELRARAERGGSTRVESTAPWLPLARSPIDSPRPSANLRTKGKLTAADVGRHRARDPPRTGSTPTSHSSSSRSSPRRVRGTRPR